MNNLATPVKARIKQDEENGHSASIIYNADYQNRLIAEGLDSFTRFYDLPDGAIIKKQQDRSVLRFEMAGSIFYLKKHEREKKQSGKKAGRSVVRWCSEGGKEFAFFCAFRDSDLATAAPVAMGEKVFSDGTVQSFLLTEDFAPFVQLEYLIRHQPESLAGADNQKKRQKILLAVADYAQKMHLAGFNHQDFNATHVLLDGLDSGGKVAMALFDLQRVDQNPFQKFRWPIKSLAEFNYSSRENNVFSDEERYFLFRAYKNKLDQPLSIFERFQWQWIEAKTNRIARHTAKRHARNRR